MSDVKSRALWLLQFAEDSLQEGIEHPLTLDECLEDADGALRVMKKILKKEQMLFVRFSISPLSHIRFSEIAREPTTRKRDEAINRCLQFVSATRIILADEV